MSLARRLFRSFDGPARVSPYFYVPPKRRWWPMLAAFAAGGVCVLALLGSSPRTEEANVAQKPIVHQVRPGTSTRASSLPKPAIGRTTTSERADAAGVVPPAAQDPADAPSVIAATPQSAGTSATPTAAAAPDAAHPGTAMAGAQTATTFRAVQRRDGQGSGSTCQGLRAPSACQVLERVVVPSGEPEVAPA
jgi:hypothetical protein